METTMKHGSRLYETSLLLKHTIFQHFHPRGLHHLNLTNVLRQAWCQISNKDGFPLPHKDG